MRVDGEHLDLLFETFFDITSLVRAERGDSALFARVLDCCSEVLRADRAMLLRVRGDCLERYTRCGRGGRLQHDELPGTEGLLDWLEREGRPFVGPAGEWHLPLPQPVFERSAGSLVCAPLVAKESQLGLLLAVRDTLPVGFGSSDLKLLTVLANQTAIALENTALYERLKREAVTDGLTGIHNYRSLMNALRTEFRRARRHDQVFTFVMADVDHLKIYNERFGHLAGSQVLAEVARLLVGNCRSTDIVGKYGGDEFAVILPQTGVPGALAVGERMRAAIERHTFKHVPQGEVTCTFGVAVFPTDATDMRALIRQADRVLFTAKRAGKNVVLSTQDLQEPAGTSPAD
ncbi:MAG: diguanylate cyclase [Candidatus Krumholzibacteriia bacterium]